MVFGTAVAKESCSH